MAEQVQASHKIWKPFKGARVLYTAVGWSDWAVRLGSVGIGMQLSAVLSDHF
jgi:hypothetical protein